MVGNSEMNRQKGYSLMELAIVLVVLGLLTGGILKGFSLYRERAEFLANGRASELQELIDMDKGTRATGAPAAPADPADPGPEAEPAPEFEETPEVADNRPRWVRWMDWWKNTRANNGRRNR